MVPDWRSKSDSEVGTKPRLALQFWILACGGALFLVYQLWMLPTLTDWVSSAVDEGYINHAAERVRQGAWPHRDFFYLWTPGTAYLHAVLQKFGLSWLGERAVALFASLGTLALLYRKESSRGLDRILLLLLWATFSFSLWNIPYSSWYAVFFALLAVSSLSRSLLLAGAFFALSFWFKQNIGILSCVGSAIFFAREKSKLRFLISFALGLLIPFSLIGIFGGGFALSQSLRQIFLFPLRYPQLMGTAPAASAIAAPLTAIGLWLLSLFFLRAGAGSRSARLLQVGVIVYIAVYFYRDPHDFITAGFVLLSLLAWPVSIALRPKREHLYLWLPGAGIFLQVFPRLDFQHFLFVSPLTFYFLVGALHDLSARYPLLPKLWVRLPAILLLAGGIFFQSEVLQIRFEGKEDSQGRISTGPGNRLNEEVTAVWRFLKNEGLPENGAILVLPNATAVYRWTGFQNITPHQQFFPGYVEAYGAKQSEVLSEYRKQGGKFLVVQERSGLEINVPEIADEIQRDYEVVKSFPENFTIYAPRK